MAVTRRTHRSTWKAKKRKRLDIDIYTPASENGKGHLGRCKTARQTPLGDLLRNY